MAGEAHHQLDRDALCDYFAKGATAVENWQVGMELEKLGRHRESGLPLAYDGCGATILKVLEQLQTLRGGEPIQESGNFIGLDAEWGTITLEPGGQVEWSSKPRPTLSALAVDFNAHIEAMKQVATSLQINWLDVAVDPHLPVERMEWMPKKRYGIMREYLRKRGALAHRMMTQSASIQCAFDFADSRDWVRKFHAAAYLAPLATALFANSSRIDGAESGYRCMRERIWRQTDNDRCGLPARVFEPGFDLASWIDWMLDVPLLFVQGPEGLLPPDGRTFRQRLESPDGASLTMDDWATHGSSIFTEVRSSTYLEVRSADLQPDERIFSAPAFWTAMLYSDDATECALELGRGLDHAGWMASMESASRLGLAGEIAGQPLRNVAERCLAAAARAFGAGVRCGEAEDALHLEQLAAHHAIDIRV
jgi:glutamate--cysteine ligase